MAETHYAKVVWSGGAFGPTKSVANYSREFRAEFEGKPPIPMAGVLSCYAIGWLPAPGASPAVSARASAGCPSRASPTAPSDAGAELAAARGCRRLTLWRGPWNILRRRQII